ncbi:2-dehydropantoate 2-reductase [Rhodoplanes sp. TEM]|uniref:2-dehydropantoate 2-reductase n=1 Tax=Rhodoplanes tepidamans TaxID=200616 RepID=A0ABT5JC86_RHOTP|nr:MULTISPECIES: 2-dehydropantoate 2-reductase [Rhodoplanes]MDC7787217.1 2-dehydropantoate 2-reductase [Rhodoplanes tepidamans]MDC7984183.1 2-dehydropantoate 2-reductase [Rhodoplanes sp. TEM]MDQ0356016.1 2-dehydropantoate 2-reductase [Rhodoplanes tepidamans]
MRIAVMGSGGLGGFFGGRLAKGGADVVFMARGAHLAALKATGLTIESPEDPFTLPAVQATDDPATIGPVDLVLFTVKLWDTEAAARAIAPIVGPRTAVVSLQNGVQKDDMLRPILGDNALMGAIAQISTTIARPGVIAQTGTMQRLVFGEFDGARSERAERFLAACLAGGIKAEISTDITREIWQKFVFLVGLSALTCATRCTIGPVRENPHTRAMLLGVMEEVVAVGRAHRVAVPEDFAAERLAFIDTLPAGMVASMFHDLAAGRRLELPWLSGGVVDLGAAVGVPTPLNRAIRDVLVLHADGRPA